MWWAVCFTCEYCAGYLEGCGIKMFTWIELVMVYCCWCLGNKIAQQYFDCFIFFNTLYRCDIFTPHRITSTTNKKIENTAHKSYCTLMQRHETWNQILNRGKKSLGITRVEAKMCAFCSAWNIPNKCSLVQLRDYRGKPLSNWRREYHESRL